MGCCESSSMRGEEIGKMVKFAIEKNKVGVIKNLFVKRKIKDFRAVLSALDQPVIELDGVKLNALNYSVSLGKHLMFSVLVMIGCSLDVAEEELRRQNSSVLYLICSKGHSDMLSVYLPMFLKRSQDREESNEVEQTPLNAAVSLGHLNVVAEIYKLTFGMGQVPVEIDFLHPDGKLKENSALVACRSGNFHIVKFLHSKFPELLFYKNIVGDNAIHIACCGSLQHPTRPYLSILKFLVQVAGLDLKQNYLKSLITVEDSIIKEWIESELNQSNSTEHQLLLTPSKYNSEKKAEVIQNISTLSNSLNLS